MEEIEQLKLVLANLELAEIRRYSELKVSLKNIGCDLGCGACASLFYTGTNIHEHTCGKGK